MIEITRQFTGLAKKLQTISDVVEVLQWAIDHQGLYCTVSARTDGTWLIELGGVDTASVYPSLGEWVVYDGDNFFALTDEAFTAKGYVVNP